MNSEKGHNDDMDKQMELDFDQEAEEIALKADKVLQKRSENQESLSGQQHSSKNEEDIGEDMQESKSIRPPMMAPIPSIIPSNST